ncbi:MAG TPA: 3-hydroxyacyl-CoA dehydrogenase NAD-binding domain-containing protein [Terracidiphilus sp.]|nr:3-hydroxyacyl-CoA dehydrogenase NAD-binding domain-containing protein [Terracidiphilus sp.]
MNVAIIGAGPLGRWLALAAAKAGFQVQLEDVMPANLHHAQEYVRREYSHTDAVNYVSTIEDAVRSADLVIDCVPDELESKLEIFCLLDRMAPPHTIIATPTTRLSIADLASCTYRADKCVGIVVDARRFAEAIPPGELRLRTGPQTSSATVEAVGMFWRGLGFEPQFEPDPVA